MEDLIDVWTPLHHRIISHRIGDGTVTTQRTVSWDNKHIIGFCMLCRTLKIKVNNPVRSDLYGTMKTTIPNYLYKSFANIFDKDYEKLKSNRAYLLDSTSQLPDDFKFQTILSVITDDGSCSSWLLVVFEDMDKTVVKKVQALWESLFPKTSSINFHFTKKGKKVYHLYANRDGIVRLYKKLEETLEEYGPFAGLWWKEEALLRIYLKAVSQRGRMLEERRRMKDVRANALMNLVKEQGYATLKDIQKEFNLSRDRAVLLVYDLRRSKKLKLVGHTYHAKYVLVKQ